MASHYCNVISKKFSRAVFSCNARRGAVALEFAILAIPFFMWVLFIFELSYDLFTQEALDAALRSAVRQIQTGNAQGLTTGQDFINAYLCPAASGLLECNNMSVSVTALDATELDYSFAPMPIIQLNQGVIVPFNDNAGGAFCNAMPKQLVLVQALYIGPSFVAGLLPGILSARYGNGMAHPTLSTSGFVVEPYVANALGTGAAPSC
jgi:Flp pilus assembly protein TadG